jgi:hypothetical protein
MVINKELILERVNYQVFCLINLAFSFIFVWNASTNLDLFPMFNIDNQIM